MDTFFPINCPTCEQIMFYTQKPQEESEKGQSGGMLALDSLHPDWRVHPCCQFEPTEYFKQSNFQALRAALRENTPIPKCSLSRESVQMVRKRWGVVMSEYQRSDGRYLRLFLNTFEFLTTKTADQTPLLRGNLIDLQSLRRKTKGYRVDRIARISLPHSVYDQCAKDKAGAATLCELVVGGDELPRLEQQIDRIIDYIQSSGGRVSLCYPLPIENGKHQRCLVAGFTGKFQNIEQFSLSESIEICSVKLLLAEGKGV